MPSRRWLVLVSLLAPALAFADDEEITSNPIFVAAQPARLHRREARGAQHKRQADASRSLATKATEKALNDLRISADKIEKAMKRMADIKRTELKPVQ